VPVLLDAEYRRSQACEEQRKRADAAIEIHDVERTVEQRREVREDFLDRSVLT